jgi:glucose/arabinose dehydrogenase
MERRRLAVQLCTAILLAACLVCGSSIGDMARGGPQKTDSLYIGDAKDGSVQRFDVPTGDFGDIFVPSGRGGLHEPRGMVFDSEGNLLVVNQNVGLPIAGEILKYDGKGRFLGALVSASDQDAPFAPRGMVLSDGILFVASVVSDQQNNPGSVLAYDVTSGALVGTLTPDATFNHPFHPRGVVIGPDGLLYVSNMPNLPAPDGTGLGGQVLRFDPGTKAFIDVFIDDGGGVGHLNRPEGLVFGPNGFLYITSFRAAGGDTDAIRIYTVIAGSFTFTDKIDLHNGTTDPRAFAQALLFGPGGLLYVPITGNSPHTTGDVRRYNVSNKAFDIFATSAHLGNPWYLTFGKTDPATLDYTP